MHQFCIPGQVLVPDKVKMKMNTLNAKLNIKYAMKAYGGKSELIPVTRELLIKAHFSYSKYKCHLDEEKHIVNRREIEKIENEKEEKIIKLLNEQFDEFPPKK